MMVDIQVPKNLNSKQRRLLEEFALSMDPGSKVNGANGSKVNGANGSKANGQGAANGGAEGNHEAEDEADKDKGLFDRIKDTFG